MGTVFTDYMGAELQYRRFQRRVLDQEECEDNWLRITQQAHDLFCSCGDWQVHFQFALSRKYGESWHISQHGGTVGVVHDTGSSGAIPETGDIDSDLECAAALAAVEGDTNGLDEDVPA